MARTALRAGREVVIANSRGPESLATGWPLSAPECRLVPSAKLRHRAWSRSLEELIGKVRELDMDEVGRVVASQAAAS